MSEGVLKSVAIRGLFGHRDVTFDLEPYQPTILTGANGTGKSTVLRLIYAVSSGDVETLLLAPIESMVLEFKSLPKFSLRRFYRDDTDIQLQLDWGHFSNVIELKRQFSELPTWAVDALRENGWDPDRTMDNLVEHMIRAEVRPSEMRGVRDTIKRLSEDGLEIESTPWLADLQDLFPAIFVTDQRLVIEESKAPGGGAVTHANRMHSSRRSISRAVDLASRDIARRIAQADSDYARRSQAIDRKFPADVVAAMQQNRTEPKYATLRLLDQVEKKRENLRLVGLLDSDDYQPTLGSEGLDEVAVRPVVATFLRSTLSKLEALDSLASKLTAFKAFLDTRFGPKYIQLSRAYGVRVVLNDGTSLRPSQLSSGEQQMMVLAWEILFRTDSETLVLIDEPEISLHVLWQDSLVTDLLSMGKASQLQFLMATHSPAIVAMHPDLERSLDEVEDF